MSSPLADADADTMTLDLEGNAPKEAEKSGESASTVPEEADAMTQVLDQRTANFQDKRDVLVITIEDDDDPEPSTAAAATRLGTTAAEEPELTAATEPELTAATEPELTAAAAAELAPQGERSTVVKSIGKEGSAVPNKVKPTCIFFYPDYPTIQSTISMHILFFKRRKERRRSRRDSNQNQTSETHLNSLPAMMGRSFLGQTKSAQ
jgi:hypothetical protein